MNRRHFIRLTSGSTLAGLGSGAAASGAGTGAGAGIVTATSVGVATTGTFMGASGGVRSRVAT